MGTQIHVYIEFRHHLEVLVLANSILDRFHNILLCGIGRPPEIALFSLEH